MWTVNFQRLKLVLEKAEEPEIKLPASSGSLKKQESSRKTSISAFLTTPKPLTVWITTNCGKFLKTWEYHTANLPPEKSVCRSKSNSKNWKWNKSYVQFSRSVVSKSLLPHRLQHARLPCPSPTPGAYSNSCPSSWWCHATISSFVVSFSCCLQFFSASGSFLVSQLFTSGGQSIFRKIVRPYQTDKVATVSILVEFRV